MDDNRFELLCSGTFVARTEQDWKDVGIGARLLFKPRAPIDEGALFVGRIPQIRRMLDVLLEDGAHAVIYGERGVGKTSLANIINDQIVIPAKLTKVAKISCTADDTFVSIWSNVFYDWKQGGRQVREVIAENPQPFTIFKIAESVREQYLVILDEFDRVTDARTKILIADTIKYLSDNPVGFTIAVVGVGESIEHLFGSHLSIQRCCVQIPMPRMSNGEMREIINKRLPFASMRITPEALDGIIKFSQGLPGYVHLLGQLCAVAAVECRSQVIEEGHLEMAIRRALEGADESTRQEYYRAIQSTKPDNRYREVLLACARAKKNELGRFSATDVSEPYSEIMGRPMSIEHFARHLNAFSSEERGPVLRKSGAPKRFMYQFANPLLEPLVLMNGIPERAARG